MGTTGRSALAVLAGLVTVLVIDGLCYFISMHVFQRSFDHPTAGFLLANLLYSYTSRTFGGYIAATIAPSKPLLIGLVLAGLLLLVGFYNLSKGVGVFSRVTVFVLLLNVAGPLFAILGAFLRSRSRTVVA